MSDVVRNDLKKIDTSKKGTIKFIPFLPFIVHSCYLFKDYLFKFDLCRFQE